MKTKPIKSIRVGDVIKVEEPAGTAEITSHEKFAIVEASGGCYQITAKILTGPNKGQRITNQLHAGSDLVELA